MTTFKADMSGVVAKIDRICTNRKVGIFAASEAARLMEQFVPRLYGTLRTSAVVSPFLVTYTMPYAHYQWEGVSESGVELHYTTPLTQSHWEEAVDKGALARSIAGCLDRNMGSI